MTRPTPEQELIAALAAAQAPETPPAGVAERLKARVMAAARDRNGTSTTASAAVPKPAPLTLRADEGPWLQLTPKVAMRILRQDPESRSFLLRLAPGAVLPAHDHPLDEECYVLEGEVRFGDIRIQAGDYHLAPAGVPHGLVRSRRGALLLLRGATPASDGHPELGS